MKIVSTAKVQTAGANSFVALVAPLTFAQKTFWKMVPFSLFKLATMATITYCRFTVRGPYLNCLNSYSHTPHFSKESLLEGKDQYS
jgi:hypothetical protein